ncbi:MAG: DUF6435 family protein [Bacteroidia bacterium]
MFSMFKPADKTPFEAQYIQLKMAARQAQQSGDLRKYADLVAEINRTLVQMFPSRKSETGKKTFQA